MARRTNEFQTIRSEGGLLPPDLLRRVLDPKEKIPGTAAEDYGLPQGERINETITQSWNRLRRHWAEFSEAAQRLPEGEAGTGLTNDKWNIPLLRELGFGLLPTSAGPEIAGRTYAINRFFGPAAIHLIGCGLSPDRRTAGARGAAAANPHGLVQEFLNRADDYLWGIVSNGLMFRILRDNQALSRQSYLEFDLEAMFSGEVFSDFVLLWLMGHATRFTVRDGGRPESCWLEQWTKLAEEQGTRALESLKGGVEKALEVLGQGFVGHPRNAVLRENMRSGALSPSDFHGQLLRIVYRLIFLFVAEDRTLEGASPLHPRDDSDKGRLARERYASNYSTARLRELASRIRGSRHGDFWYQFNLIVGALSGDAKFAVVREYLALPSLGSFLWSPASTRDLNCTGLTEDEGTELTNEDFLEAIRHLAFTRQGRVLRPVDYRNLASEELGGVYESLLALTPQVSGDGAHFTFAEFSGNERKTSGSYYTSDSLVQCLLDSALDPVVEEAIKGKTGVEAEKALLSLKVCDPAVGSGHFLVGAAHRLARQLARIRAIAQGESEPSPPLYQAALRDVIGHCLYGVDTNPMAAELCKVSLWLDALEPGKPLSFLDQHIRVGNSLLGTTPSLIVQGIPDDAFKPIEGDVNKACTELKKRNRGERKGLGPLFARQEEELQLKLAKAASTLGDLPDDRPEDIHRKESKLREYEETDEYHHKKLLADTWCAAFVIKRYLREPNRVSSASGITQGSLNDLARGKPLPLELCAEVESLSAQYRFFHWHLAFPEVFAKGGFDCILGNPPWERVKLQEKEWFSERSPEIANAPNAAARKRMIEELKTSDPSLYEKFLNDSRKAEGESHIMRNSGRYPLCGRGDINVYTVFAEGMRNLINDRGRAGCVLPSGIATDDTTKFFFQNVVETKSLVSLFDFENKGIFPAVDSRMKFCLFTSGSGAHPSAKAAEFVFFAHAVDDLRDSERRFTLSAEDIELINPNTRTCPIFRSNRDAELTKAIYRRVPVLIKEAQEGRPEENPWGVTFSRMFDMSNDSHLFRTREQLEAEGWQLDGNVFRKDGEEYLPLYEAKMATTLDHRSSRVIRSNRATIRQAQPENISSTEHRSPDIYATPLYWVARSDIYANTPSFWNKKWASGWRRVSATTNERTFLQTVFPTAGFGDSIFLMFFDATVPAASTMVVSLASFVFDYVVRQKMGGVNLSFFLVAQLPILPPSTYVQCFLWQKLNNVNFHYWLLPRVLELIYTAWDLKDFAIDYGYNGPPFHWDEERRFLLRCELDAAFFRLYLGSEDEWRKEPEALTKAFPSPRHAVEYIMETFPIVKRKDEAVYGSYRTKDTILEIYDALTEAILTGKPYETSLNPPPGPPTNDKGNFLPLPEWLPGKLKPADWPINIHFPKEAMKKGV